MDAYDIRLLTDEDLAKLLRGCINTLESRGFNVSFTPYEGDNDVSIYRTKTEKL